MTVTSTSPLVRMLERYGHATDQEAARAVAGTSARNAAALIATLPDVLTQAQRPAGGEGTGSPRTQKRTHAKSTSR